MGSLLDTDVASQPVKAMPDERVVRWLSQQRPGDLYLSTISLLEIRKGIEALPHGRKRERLTSWLREDLRSQYADRLVGVDDRIAEDAGLLIAKGKKAGAEPQVADALIAATARVLGLRLATLNRRHFEKLDVELVEF